MTCNRKIYKCKKQLSEKINKIEAPITRLIKETFMLNVSKTRNLIVKFMFPFRFIFQLIPLLSSDCSSVGVTLDSFHFLTSRRQFTGKLAHSRHKTPLNQNTLTTTLVYAPSRNHQTTAVAFLIHPWPHTDSP